MGLTITRERFGQQEYDLFNHRIRDNLKALAALLERDDFGIGPSSLGAELEFYLIDSQGSVAPINKQIIADCGDPRLQPELNRFNLEYNVDPVATRGAPFSILEQRIDSAISSLRDAAARHGARVIATGILPTLGRDDLGAGAMTDEPRYRALAAGLKNMRDGPFTVEIDGPDPIVLTNDSVTLEGANTSLQVHWRVEPKNFADTFNAVQMVTPLALAIGANSPLLMGHRLWDETRIALFKQSIDYRSHFDHGWQLPSRIPFGFGWVRGSALELFAETAALFPPLLPIAGNEDSIAVVADGGTPQLEELRLHHGTVWSWNRAIYDPADNGHLRIEMRALPAGPTTRDMAANAALMIGLAEALRPTINQLLPALPYRYAEYNFYRAAKLGLQARLIWPTPGQNRVTEQPVGDIIRQLLPQAADGLSRLEIDSEEIHRTLQPIEERLGCGLSPADWQRRLFEKLLRHGDAKQASHELVEIYLREQLSGRTLANWSDRH